MNTGVATSHPKFAAMLLFQYRVVTAGVSNKRRICEKRLILLNAQDGKAALRAAKTHGRKAQLSYRNDGGGQVRFEFVGVLDLLHLGEECEPGEVWYDIFQLVEPMERRGMLLPSDARLQGIAEDRPRAKKKKDQRA